jgi:hypothetical protein
MAKRKPKIEEGGILSESEGVLKDLLDVIFNTTATAPQKKKIAETKGDPAKIVKLLVTDKSIFLKWIIAQHKSLMPDIGKKVREARARSRKELTEARDKERLEAAKVKKEQAEAEIKKLEGDKK